MCFGVFVQMNGDSPQAQSRPLGYVIQENGCWDWVALDPEGYGRWSQRRGTKMAHRRIYELLRGPIPKGLTIDHLCRNRACCNPDHLEPVTFLENVMRGHGPAAQNARKTHCPQGHPYNAIRVDGKLRGRRCSVCEVASSRERYRKGKLSPT